MNPVDKVLEALEDVKTRGDGWRARCSAPGHEDRNPSLDIDVGDDGTVLLHCRSRNCDYKDILTGAGLEPRDTFPDERPGNLRYLNGGSKGSGSASKGQGRPVATYEVKDTSGHICGLHKRYENESDKWFKWFHPDGTPSKQGEIKTTEMPLYGSEEIPTWPEGCRVVVVEGETPRDALRRRGVRCVGTVCGSSTTPSRAVLESLRGFEVVLWRDGDPAGEKHMRKIAAALDGIASMVRWFEWVDAPEDIKGPDAADHPAVKSGDRDAIEDLAKRLRDAPIWEPDEVPAPDDGRMMLGRAITEGIEPPAELVGDVMLEGKTHSIYSAPGIGKTFLMLWIVLRVIERGLSVIIYDTENGPRIMAERLEQLGADPAKLDKYVHYYFHPDLPTNEEGLMRYGAKLDEVEPALVVFDSWINFLASNGLDENSSNDIATFAAHYLHPARKRNIATLMLDHVPHEAQHARGSTRKKDEVDVMWSLRSLQPFNRERVGQIVLNREKDREGWLPLQIPFSVGGDGMGGFVFARSAGTFEAAGEDGLKPSEKKSLEALESFGKSGAKATEWQKAAEVLSVKHRSFYNARTVLLRKDLVLQEKDRYFISSANKCNSSAVHQNAPDPDASAIGAPPLRGAPNCTTGTPEGSGSDVEDLQKMFEESR